MADISQLALRPNPFPALDYRLVLNQIESRQKCRRKLPDWYQTPGIYYPLKIAVEQASSQRTAAYKSRWVSGAMLCDITGGMGVDAYGFSPRVEQVFHFEQQPELSGIAAHNFEALGVQNIRCRAQDGWVGILHENLFPDWIYVDPSRRNAQKGKVFLLSDCEPDAGAMSHKYLSRAPHVMIKTAPLLDISAGLAELEHVAQIHVVALEGEVKELLWVLQRDFAGNPEIIAVNLEQHRESVFAFTWKEPVLSKIGPPQRYLYEPNAAIMKSGGFHQIGHRFQLVKLHTHTHLYTSDELQPDFPGRIFEIDQSMPYEKSAIRTYLQGTQANVTTRNFPLDVASVRKKWKISDGGARYVFFTTGHDDVKIVLLCSKIVDL